MPVARLSAPEVAGIAGAAVRVAPGAGGSSGGDGEREAGRAIGVFIGSFAGKREGAGGCSVWRGPMVVAGVAECAAAGCDGACIRGAAMYKVA